MGQFRQLADLNLFLCRNLHSSGLEHLANHCTNLTKLNIDEVNYLTDESVNRFIEAQGPSLKMLWLDGESLSDESFANFHKMRQLELLSISFCDNLGPAGLQSIAKLANLGRHFWMTRYIPASSGELHCSADLILFCSFYRDPNLLKLAYKLPKSIPFTSASFQVY